MIVLCYERNEMISTFPLTNYHMLSLLTVHIVFMSLIWRTYVGHTLPVSAYSCILITWSMEVFATGYHRSATKLKQVRFCPTCSQH